MKERKWYEDEPTKIDNAFRYIEYSIIGIWVAATIYALAVL